MAALVLLSIMSFVASVATYPRDPSFSVMLYLVCVTSLAIAAAHEMGFIS